MYEIGILKVVLIILNYEIDVCCKLMLAVTTIRGFSCARYSNLTVPFGQVLC